MKNTETKFKKGDFVQVTSNRRPAKVLEHTIHNSEYHKPKLLAGITYLDDFDHYNYAFCSEDRLDKIEEPSSLEIKKLLAKRLFKKVDLKDKEWQRAIFEELWDNNIYEYLQGGT